MSSSNERAKAFWLLGVWQNFKKKKKGTCIVVAKERQTQAHELWLRRQRAGCWIWYLVIEEEFVRYFRAWNWLSVMDPRGLFASIVRENHRALRILSFGKPWDALVMLFYMGAVAIPRVTSTGWWALVREVHIVKFVILLTHGSLPFLLWLMNTGHPMYILERKLIIIE